MADGLIADIGGTNIRIARVTAEQGLTGSPREYRCAAFSNVDAALTHFVRETGMQAPAHVALAVASAVTGDIIRFTNSGWCFSQQDLKMEMKLASLRVLNDFEALAVSLPCLGPEDLHQVGGAQGVAGTPMAVIGPGTGLGVAAIIPTGDDGWMPISSEGGHATIAPANEFEADLLCEAWGERSHVSCEAFISGTGLPILYRSLARMFNKPWEEEMTADEIGARAMAGTDPLCASVIESFCDMLGTAAGNVALTFCARGGVFIGGGIVPKVLPLFMASHFRTRFEAKGRFAGYLEPIPVNVITGEMPALAGLSATMVRTLRGL